jgi:hypothetical protein
MRKERRESRPYLRPVRPVARMDAGKDQGGSDQQQLTEKIGLQIQMSSKRVPGRLEASKRTGHRVRELHGGAAKLADDKQVRHNVQGIGGGGG